MFNSVEETITTLSGHQYIADVGLATSLFLSLKMGKPLFLEGAPGVGKTEIAKVLASVFDTQMIRLQCYEGLDINHAVYEWNYQRQLIEIQVRQDERDTVIDDIFTEKFLMKRALLQAVDPANEKPPVLLIDELDRADEEFESFLLELLSDFQVTVPEIGTIQATHRPIVIITSNRTREIHDALKRRCIYQWIDYPSRELEIAIIRLKQPQISERLSQQIVDFVQQLRHEELYKPPGIAETLDWAEALSYMNVHNLLDLGTVNATLGVILKYQDDVEKIQGNVAAQVLENVV